MWQRQLGIYSYVVGKMQDVKLQYIWCMTFLQQTKRTSFTCWFWKHINSINRQVFLHIIKHRCPPVATFKCNWYNVPRRLFVFCGKELLSWRHCTGSYPTAMTVYGIALTPLTHLAISYYEKDPKMVAFADNLTSAWRLCKLCSWWKDNLDVGPKYRYFPKPSKIILIIKPKYELKVVGIFDNSNTKIISCGQRHLQLLEYHWNITEIQPQKLILQIYMASNVNTTFSITLFQL